VRRLAHLAIAVAAAAICSSASGAQPGRIPWLPTPAPPPPALAPPCQASALTPKLALEEATGHFLGGVVVGNSAGAACSLVGRPNVRFDGVAAYLTPWLSLPGEAEPPAARAESRAQSSLRALAPGGEAFLPLFWSNWCPSDQAERSPGSPPAALVITLPKGAGDLRVDLYGTAPRCEDALTPSMLSVGSFSRPDPPPSTHLPLRAAIIGDPTTQATSGVPALHARRGRPLHFTVALTNVSSQPFRFPSCPVYREGLAGRLQPHVLNCKPMGTLAPGARALFAMVVSVPPDGAVGGHTLRWLLAEATYRPPSASGAVVVTR
jgi:hypothetical protein